MGEDHATVTAELWQSKSTCPVLQPSCCLSPRTRLLVWALNSIFCLLLSNVQFCRFAGQQLSSSGVFNIHRRVFWLKRKCFPFPPSWFVSSSPTRAAPWRELFFLLYRFYVLASITLCLPLQTNQSINHTWVLADGAAISKLASKTAAI